MTLTACIPQQRSRTPGRSTGAGKPAKARVGRDLSLKRCFRPRLERLEDRLAPAAWNPIGPAPILNGQTPGSDPVSGRITALAADPTDANTIYITAASGGVWKTTNAGTTWTPLTDSQSTLFMGSIAIAAGGGINNRFIYAGTGEANNGSDNYYGFGVLVSKDSGATWTLTGNSVFNRSSIGTVVIDPSDATGNTAYAAVSGIPTNGANRGFTGNYGIWKTTNGGATWTDTTAGIVSPTGNNLFSDLVMDPGSPNVLYAAVGTGFGGSANGVYKTTTGGMSWTQLGSFPGGSSTGRISLTIEDVAGLATLYASVSDVGPHFGETKEIEKSTDGGATWSAVMTRSPLSSNYINYMGAQGDYDQTIIIDPSVPSGNTVYAAGQLQVIKTTDGGTTWTDISVGSNGHGPHADHHGIGFDANGHLLDGNDGGLWRLDPIIGDGFSWTDLNGNLQITQFYGIALDPTNANVAYGGSQDNGTEKYSGSLSWNHIFGGDGIFVRVNPSNPSQVYTEFNFGVSLERSDNGGSSFALKTSGILSNFGSFGVPYVIDSLNNNRLILGTDFVNQSLNNGDSWTAIGIPGINGFNPGDTGAITAIATLGNTVYAATDDGHVWITTTDGSSWTRSDPIPGFKGSPGGTPGSYRDIEIDPSDATGRTAYIVTAEFSEDIDGTSLSHNHVFKTTNAGGSWTDISGNLPDLPTWSIAIDDNNTLYVGNDSGVFSSTNGGTSWSPFGTGMPNVQVVGLQFNASLRILAAGTHGRGMFEIVIPQAPVVTPPANQTATEGASTSFSLGTFTDASSGPWTVTVNWGDTTPAQTFAQASTGTIAPESHTFGEEGSYTVSVTVKNTTTAVSGSASFKVAVSDPAVVAKGVPVSAKECIAFNLPVATFMDPGGAEPNAFDDPGGLISNHYTASVDFGDGKGASPGVITYNGVPGDDSKTNTFTVTATHTFDEEGTFTITTTIHHEMAPDAVIMSTATVRDNYGLLLLDPTGTQSLMVTGNGSVTVNHCGAIVVDSSDPQAIFLTGNAVATATEADVGLGGGFVTHGNAVLNLLEPEFNHEAATPDPIALPLPPVPAVVSTSALHISSGSVTLSPGTYVGGIVIDGTAVVTLLPGVYYMQGGGFSVSGKGSVTDHGAGVLLVNAPAKSSDVISITSQGSVSLTASSSLTGGLASYNHIVLFQDPASANTLSVTGKGSLTVSGTVYAPAALLKIDGNGNAVVSTDTNSTGGQVIVFDAQVTGNGVLTINADPPTASVNVAAAPVGGGALAANPFLQQLSLALPASQPAGGEGLSAAPAAPASPSLAIPATNGPSYLLNTDSTAVALSGAADVAPPDCWLGPGIDPLASQL